MGIGLDELNKAELAAALGATQRATKLKQTQLYNEELETVERLIKELRTLAEQERRDEEEIQSLIGLSKAAVEIARALQKPL